jgi:hypothetical protein
MGNFDVTVSKMERLVTKDSNGMFQSKENGISITEKDVQPDQVKLKTLELQKQVKIYISNMQVLDGAKTVEQVASEIKPYTDMVERARTKVNNGTA